MVYFDPATGSRGPEFVPGDRGTIGIWSTSGIVSAFKKIWGDSWGPRLEYILYATVAALLHCDNTSLLGVSRMLHDARYRAWVVRRSKTRWFARSG